MLKNMIKQLGRGLESVSAVLGVLLLWELLPRLGLVSVKVLPPFSVVFSKFIAMVISGELVSHTAISLERAFGGFIVSVIIAIPLAFLLGWSQRAERIIDPLGQLCRNTATLAMYPLFILIFGLGESAKIAIIAWGTLWPILLNTIEGVRAVDPLLVKSARSMAISRLGLFIKVILPMAFPLMFTGIRLAASRAVIILVAAEMMGAHSGLGYLVFHAEAFYMISEMYSAIIMLVILGVSINYTLVTCEKRISHWKEQITEV
ncbi:MAG: ABC transporter permease [Syntrophomonadaceae bacterium]|nr:ABC transporter permease [Syntrophomonadaceae bacterium]